MADHPELFYVVGASLQTTVNRGSGIVERVDVSGSYCMTPEEAKIAQQSIDAAASSYFAALPDDADDYTTAKCLYELLAKSVSYDFESAALPEGEAGRNDSQTVFGALVNGRAVCGGYASAFQYLMKQRGLPCTYVTGTARGESHAWCVANLDGAYYFVDPTWGDPQHDGGSLDYAEMGFVDYDYLNVTSSDIAVTHQPDCPYALPSCDSDADNYYVREGLLFGSGDEGRFAVMAADSLSAGLVFQSRCVDFGSYSNLKESMVENGALARYLPTNSYYYSCSDEHCSIAIFPA